MQHRHESEERDLRIRLEPAGINWWSKPLAMVEGRPLPAELVILRMTLRAGEAGAWLNSCGTKTGVIDLAERGTGHFETLRIDLPGHVQACLRSFYEHPEIRNGMYDLVIWSRLSESIRFVEVKCPKWDRQSAAQRRFAMLARERGLEVDVAEWDFDGLEGVPPEFSLRNEETEVQREPQPRSQTA